MSGHCSGQSHVTRKHLHHLCASVALRERDCAGGNALQLVVLVCVGTGLRL